ncbi:signal peptidase I family protein [Imleria badia]|nr:signal peptidase I family protein [Imleria badia]
MLPTFETSGEIAFESIASHRLASCNLTRGELVSLRSPMKPNRIICKRIIGLPGDIVCVDPTALKAPSEEHVVVPKGHVWIAGDNAACSTDSRDYGPVSMGLIRGRIIARVFPLNRFQVFTHGGTYIDECDGQGRSSEQMRL